MQKYGWFSAKAQNLGSTFYRRADGSEVEVTVISYDPTDSHTKWEDIVCVGPIEDFVRVGVHRPAESCKESVNYHNRRK